MEVYGKIIKFGIVFMCLQRLEGNDEGGEDEVALAVAGRSCVRRVGTVVVKSGSAQPRVIWSDPGFLRSKPVPGDGVYLAIDVGVVDNG